MPPAKCPTGSKISCSPHNNEGNKKRLGQNNLSDPFMPKWIHFPHFRQKCAKRMEIG
jgi:hypothetical protein